MKTKMKTWDEASFAWSNGKKLMSLGKYNDAIFQFNLSLCLYKKLQKNNSMNYIDYIIFLIEDNKKRCIVWKNKEEEEEEEEEEEKKEEEEEEEEEAAAPIEPSFFKIDSLMTDWGNAQRVLNETNKKSWDNFENFYVISKKEELEKRIETLQIILKKRTIELNLLQKKCYFAFKHLNDSIRQISKHADFLFPFELLSQYSILKAELLNLKKKI